MSTNLTNDEGGRKEEGGEGGGGGGEGEVSVWAQWPIKGWCLSLVSLVCSN